MMRDIIPIGNNVAASMIKLSVTNKLPLMFFGFMTKKIEEMLLKSILMQMNEKSVILLCDNNGDVNDDT